MNWGRPPPHTDIVRFFYHEGFPKLPLTFLLFANCFSDGIVVLDIEEAILQLAKFGVKKDEVERRVKKELLIVNPTQINLQVL